MKGFENMTFCPPEKNCKNCPRLVDFRCENIKKFPSYYNAPVPSFGNLDAEVLIVGLAPGLNGANQTGRPFTNDYAGDVLYPILKSCGFATGNYGKIANDGFELKNVRITNSVRCVPPQNKVTGYEVKTCGCFLINEIASFTIWSFTESNLVKYSGCSTAILLTTSLKASKPISYTSSFDLRSFHK